MNVSTRLAMAVCAAICLTAACSNPRSAERPAKPSYDDERAHDSKHRQEHASDDEHASGHGGHHDKRFTDPEKLADDWNDPARDRWQRPEAVVDAMGLDSGMTVADVGVGTGYFVPHLAEAVGSEGRVFAVDIERSMLDYVENLAAERGLEQVETVMAQKTNTNLDADSVDRILIVNTWHHIPNREAYSRHLRERLTEGGSVWIVDYTRDSPRGPPTQHRLDPEEVVGELEAGGLDAEHHSLELPRQYVVVGRVD